MSLIIIFENWNSNLNTSEIKKLFKIRNVKIKKLDHSVLRHDKSFLKTFFELMYKNDITSLIDSDNSSDLIGNLVIEVN